MPPVVVDENQMAVRRFGMGIGQVYKLFRFAFALPARDELNHCKRLPCMLIACA